MPNNPLVVPGRVHIDLSGVVHPPTITVDIKELIKKKYDYIPLFASLEFKNLARKYDVDYDAIVKECEQDMNESIKDTSLDGFIDLEQGWSKAPADVVVKHTFRRAFI